MASKPRSSATNVLVFAAILSIFVSLNIGRPASAGPPSAQHFAGVAKVGALFLPGAYPTLHTCTASVVKTKSRNVIMTAAHCVTGNGTGYRFAPGYRNGKTPYGVWSVTGAYGAPGWISRQDTHRDYAFLTVAPMQWNGTMRTLQSVTGGNRLGRTAQRGDRVTVIAYAAGSNDEALRCTTSVYIHDTWPAFDCGGFPGGTSGSPWLRSTPHGLVIDGDIGGLHQGGCTPSTSYSPPLGKPAQAALARAVSHAKSDVFPAAGSDGCS
jgi:V8-like Glu-specific endopeptidase